jgi:tetratricopeptide (TPR) repeat protein
VRRAWIAGVGICVAAAGAWFVAKRVRATSSSARSTTSAASEVPSSFVGHAVCASCHAREAAAWQGSDHQRAMQPATAATVLGDFTRASFTHAGVTSTFSQRGSKYLVRTDGPDGALHDYAITHTFGVAPLQQYLVEFPGGRLQALHVAWDSRPASVGGQRWFHLLPDEKIDHDDPLHWTGATENWNYMCSDCHSTNVRKSWSEQTQSYSTRFAEMSVSCEACHGPGSQHVAWAAAPPELQRSDDRKGLAIALDERAGVFWARTPPANKPSRSRPRTSDQEIEMCARCHSRRGLIHEDAVHGQPVEDDYRVALLDDDLYHPDGQIKGEVYEYGSFIQSRMFAEGVTCSDCHDPHSQRLRAPGDGVCMQCHEPSYATTKHHFHAEASAGARCVSCHMPATTYMVVDARRDHSIRVPRPDQSVSLGVPNACNTCHQDRTAAWAAETVERWYGHAPTGLQRFAEALAAGARSEPGAELLLAKLIADKTQPAIARASAIARLRRFTPDAFAVTSDGLGDASPLVRRAAVQALAPLEPRSRATLIAPLLDDPVRSVRLEAAIAMAGVSLALIPPALHGARERAKADFMAAQQLNGDRPEAHVARANFYAAEQDFVRAEASLHRALAVDPTFVPASVNLADLYRMLGREKEAEQGLREALARAPRDPALLHALGLSLVRTRRLRDALEPLGAAARLGRDNPRFGYVYAVALHDAGERQGALQQLRAVLDRHPYDRDSLAAIVSFLREENDAAAAQMFAARLEALEPRSVTGP